MPLPASIRSLKARLRALNEPDFWSSVVGIVLLMPLGWQIINHFQQPPPEAKIPKPKSDLEATESIGSESPTANSATAADIDNSAVLNQLLDGGVQPGSSVSALPASSPSTENSIGVVDRSASQELDTEAILNKFSTGSSPSATTTALTNPTIPIPAYASRSIAQDIALRNSPVPYVANNATPPSALQEALEKSAEPVVVETPSVYKSLDVPEEIALAQPPFPPAQSPQELPTSTPVPLTPPPSLPPSTSLLPLPTRSLPASSVEGRVVPPTPNTLPPNLNPMPTATQQTKLYPYVPERVYSSPLPALPPSPTGTNLNNTGLPPLPNPTVSPQSQNFPANPTVVETIQPTQSSGVKLEAVPLAVERLIGDGEINTFANP
jgi:hypothetical protein